MDAVKKHIADNVDPLLGISGITRGKKRSVVVAPKQLDLLEGAKTAAKEAGLWNFFLPDAETGEGLSNLDYAYIATELGKSPLASSR